MSRTMAAAEDEFATYAARMAGCGYSSVANLKRAVETRAELRELVKRPLFARMLSLVWEDERDRDIISGGSRRVLTDLYHRYVVCLARSACALLPETHDDRAQCTSDDVIKYWQLFAREQFSSGAGTSATGRLHGSRLERSRAVLLQRRLADDAVVQFIHYSVYEFLVASEISRGLESAFRARDSDEVIALFAVDLPREIRHFFLARVLLWTDRERDQLALFVADAYRGKLESVGDYAERLTIGNMLAYCMGRIAQSRSAHIIGELYLGERDRFLRNSLGWATCLTGVLDDEASAFIQEVRKPGEAASLNRGYLLYYYGDLAGSLVPPFVDDDPETDWSRTRIGTLEMMSEGRYNALSAWRRLLDVATYVNLVEFHQSELDGAAASRLSDVLKAIEGTKRVAFLRDQLYDGLRKTRGALP